MTVETRYFRSDEHTVNGLTAKKLLNTPDTAPSAYTGEIWANSPQTATVYFEFRIRHADGSTAYLKAFSKTHNEEYDGDVTVNVNIPLVELESTDAIQAEVIFDVGGEEYMHEFFITEQLNAWRLNNATWKVVYYIYYHKAYQEGLGWVTIVQFSPKRIEDFTYDEPVNFSKDISDAIGVSDVIEKARVAWKKTVEERVKLSDLMNTVKKSGGTPEGWLSGWQYRKKHEIEGSSAGAETDYQIRIKVHYGSGTDDDENVYLNSKCRSDFGDIRFTKDDGTTLLDYWMEEKVNSDYAIFWVKVPSIPASPDTATIYIYYGKSDATYVGDGDDTFLFFDDFSGTELDPNKWYIYGHTSISDGILTFYGSSSGHRIQSKTCFSAGVAWRFKAKYDLSTYYTLRSGLTDGSYPSKRFGNDPNHTCIDVTPENGNERLRNTKNSNKVDVTLQSISENTWRTWELRWLSSKTELVCFTTNKSKTNTSNVPQVDLYPAFDAEGTGQSKWYIDIVFLRKYADPEPSHDTWYAEEEVTPAAVYELTISEALSACDAYLRSWSVTRLVSDQIGAYDVITPLRIAGKLIKDYIGLLDLFSKHPASLKADSLAISDVYTTAKSIHEYFSDSINLHDYKCFKAEVYISDLMALYDIVSKHTASHISDFMNLSDRFSSYLFGKITLADGIGLYDFFTKVFTAYRTYSEQLGVYDMLTIVKAQFRYFMELINLADAITKSAGFIRSELIGLSDVIDKIFKVYREYIDGVGLFDAVSKQLLIILADYTRLYDMASKSTSRRVEDSTALSDLVEKHPAALITDSISLYDVYERWWMTHKEVVDAVGLLDVLTPMKALFEEFSEYVALVDVFARKWDIKREYVESAGLADEVTRRWGKWVLLIESIAVYDEQYLLRLRKAIARILSPKRILPAFREQSPDRVQGPESE